MCEFRFACFFLINLDLYIIKKIKFPRICALKSKCSPTPAGWKGDRVLLGFLPLAASASRQNVFSRAEQKWSLEQQEPAQPSAQRETGEQRNRERLLETEQEWRCRAWHLNENQLRRREREIQSCSAAPAEALVPLRDLMESLGMDPRTQRANWPKPLRAHISGGVHSINQSLAKDLERKVLASVHLNIILLQTSWL